MDVSLDGQQAPVAVEETPKKKAPKLSKAASNNLKNSIAAIISPSHATDTNHESSDLPKSSPDYKLVADKNSKTSTPKKDSKNTSGTEESDELSEITSGTTTENVKQLSNEKIEVAKNIYNVYITSGGPLEVNLSDKVRDNINNRIQKNEYSILMYQEAEKAVFHDLVTDAFPRFLLSEYYKKYKQQSLVETGKEMGLIIANLV